jgi:Tfp pilus assembly pilus retraction ATPase PilT
MDDLYIDEGLEREAWTSMSEDSLRDILLHVAKNKVSDVYFQTEGVVKVKKNNTVVPISKAPLSEFACKRVINIMAGNDDAYMNIMQGKPKNFSYRFKTKLPNGRRVQIMFRVNAIRDEPGICVSMRYNPSDILSLEQIGLDANSPIYKNMFPRKGLVIVTGPTDSGKTTLLYACLREAVIDPDRSFVLNTYESPIEGNLKAVARKYNVINKVISQSEVPQAVGSFNDGLNESLRRNSDIILTGEIRKSDEVEAVVNGVGKMGRLILGTMHTTTTANTVNRMITAIDGSEGEKRAMAYDLIEGLHMVVSQALLKTADGGRVAVSEHHVFDQKTKTRLQKVGMENYSQEIKKIMLEKGNTILDDAKMKLQDKIITQDEFDRFSETCGY